MLDNGASMEEVGETTSAMLLAIYRKSVCNYQLSCFSAVEPPIRIYLQSKELRHL